jgi:hypothetical protein
MSKFAKEYTTNYKAFERNADNVARDAEKRAVIILDFLTKMAALEK